ncbi:MAG: zinc ribbon domain-containing protein [Desulfurococcaceae archaeon]
MREKELVETLRMKALPEGSYDRDRLIEFLKLYRDAVQLAVNKVWNLDKVPSIATLHKMFYSELRRYGFRAHHVKQIYIHARAIAESSRRNSGRRPVLRRLTARIDRYDYSLYLESRTLVLKVHGSEEVKLKLLAPSERIEKFRGWSNYELAVKVVGGEVYVAVYFRKSVRPRKPKTVMTVDVNFDNITLAVFTPSGELLKLKRFKTPLRRILTHRIWIERVQKRYPKSWRFIKGVRRSIKRHGERITNIAWGYAHKVGEKVAELASACSAVIVFEDLSHLRSRVDGGNFFKKRLSFWFYRRIQFAVGYEALERGLEARFVNPRKTSSTCPRCGGRLKDGGSRVLRCPKCSLVGDRDVVACINLFYRYARCGGLGVPLNAPKGDANPRPMQGKQK